MINPYDVFAPMFRAPFSGDVTQEISPHLFSPEIKGNAKIEHKIQTEVASFGKQLGKILEALQQLSDATDTPLPEIDSLVSEVEVVKAASIEEIREDAEAALNRLKAVDEEACKRLVSQHSE